MIMISITVYTAGAKDVGRWHGIIRQTSDLTQLVAVTPNWRSPDARDNTIWDLDFVPLVS